MNWNKNIITYPCLNLIQSLLVNAPVMFRNNFYKVLEKLYWIIWWYNKSNTHYSYLPIIAFGTKVNELLLNLIAIYFHISEYYDHHPIDISYGLIFVMHDLTIAPSKATLKRIGKWITWNLPGLHNEAKDNKNLRIFCVIYSNLFALFCGTCHVTWKFS